MNTKSINRIIINQVELVECLYTLEGILRWMKEGIQNQEGIKKEHEGLPYPEWNKGYFECLRDLERLFKKY